MWEGRVCGGATFWGNHWLWGSDLPQPEFCFMTVLTDMARADCKVMKDIATHTCIGPNHRQLVFKKFLERVNQCPKAQEELEFWLLQLDMRMIDIKRRKLPLEQQDRHCKWGGRLGEGHSEGTRHLTGPTPKMDMILNTLNTYMIRCDVHCIWDIQQDRALYM